MNKEEADYGKWFFSGESKFLAGVTNMRSLPDYQLSEVAFVGSSNVGKSSLINSILGRNKLVRTSKNPGCTQQLNFFLIRNKLILVDFPGYGYAKVSRSQVKDWNKLSVLYLEKRQELKRVFLLIDVRRGIRDNDENIMKIFQNLAVTYQIILTKTDKVSDKEVDSVVNSVSKMSDIYSTMYPHIISTSSKKNYGFDNLRVELSKLI